MFDPFHPETKRFNLPVSNTFIRLFNSNITVHFVSTNQFTLSTYTFIPKIPWLLNKTILFIAFLITTRS